MVAEVIANKRVLVVDDETIVCESYKLALTDAGYDVHTVETGQEAIQACRAERFDVMLADLRMPDMDGLEVARVVSREFPNLRVVMITGYPSRESADEAARLGISDYLQKPLSPERLSAATAAALARAVVEMAQKETYPVVVRTEIDYRRAAKLGDRLVVEGWLNRVERARFWCAFRITRPQDGTLIAECRQMLALIEMSTGKLLRLPDHWKTYDKAESTEHHERGSWSETIPDEESVQ